MQHWKRTTEIANRLFQQGDLVDARELYLQALALAQVLFERWQDADEAVAACVISHHNLADLHLRLKQPQESAEYLCAIHQRLLQASQDQRLSPLLRDAALRQSSKTYTELLNFISEYGQYPRTERLLYRQGAQPALFAGQEQLQPPALHYGTH
ncbi:MULTISPECIES: hypothetical protein [Pseudomonas]|jgi:hypothetical protein|uniref:Tetratricopeptide repeat protein n=2 Tax=Pseudomonas TaxID=286 RepID=A0A9X8HJR9_PSEPU|nr:MULTISPECIES: hypothetical protein [Pseudomonas]KIU49683.1 hypothetical protein QV12_15530 [Pseudomonas putida]KTC20785.1 hypothetical protein AO392_07170 [Pseudomonas putida]MBG8562221.1 hypothetical protein [Pseudomonas qingdaonensis]MCO7506397.1 DUF2753 domain-containing protein [Pseudomonas sp. VE 267-6A]MCO7531611.1 DUF2753 domain-containing protein [Pseudomonas sp. 2]